MRRRLTLDEKLERARTAARAMVNICDLTPDEIRERIAAWTQIRDRWIDIETNAHARRASLDTAIWNPTRGEKASAARWARKATEERMEHDVTVETYQAALAEKLLAEFPGEVV